jgi:hypothetical protein
LAVGTGNCTASGRPVDRIFRSIRERISMWAITGADYFAAAGAHQDLSRCCSERAAGRGGRLELA